VSLDRIKLLHFIQAVDLNQQIALTPPSNSNHSSDGTADP